MRQMGMTWIATAAFVTAVASACGGSGAGVPLGPGGGGEDSGVLDSTAPPSGFSGSSSGGFSSSAPDAGGSTPGSPHDCDPSCAAAGGTCGAGLCSITENPANAPAALQTQLKAGGPADAAFTWLYPYDRTVFARGIVSPTLQ